MLSEAIVNLAQTAEAVIRAQPVGEPAANAVQAHAGDLVRRLIPMAREAELQAASTAGALAKAVDQVMRSDASATDGRPVAEMTLRAAIRDLETAIRKIDAVERQAGDFRNRFAGDVGTLASLETRLAAQVQGEEARRKDAEAEARKLRGRIKAVDKASIFNPLIKLGSELASLLTKRKTTEKALADASRRARDAAIRQAGIRHRVALATHLRDAIDQVVGHIQDVANALTLARRALGTEDDFARHLSEAPELFAAALESSLRQLRETLGADIAPAPAHA
jgi:hypothetical protein